MHALQIHLSIEYVVNQFDNLAGVYIDDSNGNDDDEVIEVDEDTYRCFMMVQDMLKEANAALHSPKLPVLLTQGAYEGEKRRTADTQLADVAAGAIFAPRNRSIEKATDLLQTQLASSVPSPSVSALGLLRSVGETVSRWLLGGKRLKQS